MPKWSQYLDIDDDDEMPRQTFQKIKRNNDHIEELKKAEKKKKKPYDIPIIPTP